MATSTYLYHGPHSCVAHMRSSGNEHLLNVTVLPPASVETSSIFRQGFELTAEIGGVSTLSVSRHITVSCFCSPAVAIITAANMTTNGIHGIIGMTALGGCVTVLCSDTAAVREKWWQTCVCLLSE
eukprot:scaffold240869_cov16-Prasinocladus_malaysianus.AAC.3